MPCTNVVLDLETQLYMQSMQHSCYTTPWQACCLSRTGMSCIDVDTWFTQSVANKIWAQLHDAALSKVCCLQHQTLHQQLLMGADLYMLRPALTLSLQVLEAKVGKGEGSQAAKQKHWGQLGQFL